MLNLADARTNLESADNSKNSKSPLLPDHLEYNPKNIALLTCFETSFL